MNKNALFDLIKSLTTAEKRSIKLLMGGQGKGRNQKYMKLFDAISRQQVYDEARLAKKFGYSHNPNGLAVAKNYLFNAVLRCLRFSERADKMGLGMVELAANIEVLYLKQQFESCKKMVDKAMSLAVENGRKDMIVLICGWERRLMGHLLEAPEYVRVLEEIDEKEKSAIRDMELENVYFRLYQKLRVLNLKYGFIKKGEALSNFTSIIKNPLLRNEEKAATLPAKIYFLSIHAEYYEALREHEIRFEWNRRLIRLFDDNTSLKKTHASQYLSALFNYLFNLLELKKYKSFEKELNKLVNFKLPSYDHELRKKKERSFIFLQMQYFNFTNQNSRVIKTLLPALERYFEKNNNIVNKYLEAALMGYTAWSYYVAEDYDKALEWIVLVDQHVDRNIFVDVFIRTRILLMTIHYELENYQYLESLVSSTVRFLESRDKLNTLESFYLKFFKKVIALDRNAKSHKQALLELQEDIKIISDYVREKSIFDIRIFRWWVESQLRKVPVAEIIRAYFEKKHTGESKTA